MASSFQAQRESTRIIRGTPEEIARFAISFFERELESHPDAPCQDHVQDKFGPAIVLGFSDMVAESQRKNPKLRSRFLTDIQSENLTQVKQLLDTKAFELRHLEGIKAKYAVTSSEYLTTTKSLENGLPDELMWSKSPELVEQTRNVFQNLWDSAIPAEIRIRQLEENLPGENDRIIYNMKEVEELGMKLLGECKREMLFIVASPATIVRYHQHIQRDQAELSRRGASYRMLAPVFDPKIAELLKGVNWRKIEPMNLGYVIFDREKMLITQYTAPQAEEKKTDESGRSHNAPSPLVLSNTFTTNHHTIHGVVSIFESLWQQSEVLEREEKAKRQAQVLQDILAHDIRNYNQVARLGVELLMEQSQNSESSKVLAGSILQAIDGSTLLLERANRLGRVLSESNPKLRAINLLEAIESSIELVKKANPKRDVAYSFELATCSSESSIPLVEADDLIYEVFANIFGNSVKYTEGDPVIIDTEVSEEERGWTISVSDHGRGIPDELKARVFARYLEGAKGSGLGMSIVHALVVDRYRGDVKIKSRVKEDYTRGTTIEIFLLKATDSLEKTVPKRNSA